MREAEKSADLAAANAANQIVRDAKLAVLEAQARVVVARAQQELLDASASEVPRLVERQKTQLLLSDFLDDRSRRLRNKAAIASETISILSQHALETGAAGEPSSEGDPSPSPNDINDDWLNIFSDHAERASSAQLQSLWARILAGEVRTPGSFSLPTLRFVAELDREIAVLFEKYVQYVVSDSIPRRQEIEGEPLQELLALEEAGLISNVGMPLHRTYSATDGKHLSIIQSKSLIFITLSNSNNIVYSISPLTRVGRELKSILPDFDGAVALIRLAKLIETSASSIELASASVAEGQDLAWRPVRKLWSGGP